MRFSRRAGGTALAAAVVLAFVAGQAARAAAGPDPAEQPLNRPNQADNVRARSALLRQADVFAGFSLERGEPLSAPRIPHCAGYPGDRSNITVTGSATSSFRKGDISMASTVLFFKTKADSDRYWRATVRFQYARCLAETLPLEFSVKVRISGANQIPMRLAGAEKAVAYRVVAQVPTKPAYSWIETAAFVKQGRAVGLIRTVWLSHVCDCHSDLGAAVSRRLRQAQ